MEHIEIKPFWCPLILHSKEEIYSVRLRARWWRPATDGTSVLAVRLWGLLAGSVVKNLQRRRLRFHPWVGKISWRRKWQLLQHCLENPMDRGAWWLQSMVLQRTWTQLSDARTAQLGDLRPHLRYWDSRGGRWDRQKRAVQEVVMESDW